ncbi:lipocalin family protein [uncultured Pontibacter sp.]|uniref:lipocalin family protein n=1 Tax=uncultured Pontibacter sp. TaxID=453356 RepID=UPI0026067CCC|nr:lipocalin family protein [uncultured Pontibacter sp.]
MNLRNLNFRSAWAKLITMMLVVVLWSCGGNEEVGTESMLSGASSKTWKANKELNAAGDKDKLTKEEKQETMQFYADGRFALGGGGSLQTGTWTYDQTAKRLSLQFEGQDMTENFEVTKLTDSKMELRATDGSVMQMEAE